ncbi:MAG: NfeD family protein [Saprospiraceae bacterium]
MFEFLSDADIYLKTFWYIAIPISTIFIIQAILTMVGSFGDMDMDFDGDSGDLGDVGGFSEYFTIRNVIHFLLGFSWAGISFHQAIPNKFFLVLAAISVGIIFVTIFFYVIQQIKKLEENNTMRFEQLIGKEAEVYLRIPAEGTGKIQVSNKGAFREVFASSQNGEIATGQKVKILQVLKDNILLVSKIELE